MPSTSFTHYSMTAWQQQDVNLFIVTYPAQLSVLWIKFNNTHLFTANTEILMLAAMTTIVIT